MNIFNDIEQRFGPVASAKLTPTFGKALTGDPAISPATKDRIQGSLVAFAMGEALGEPLEGRSRSWIQDRFGTVTNYVVPNPCIGSDTQLALMAADSLLASQADHPTRLAARLVAATVDTQGMAVRHAQSKLAAGRPWWEASKANSAGTAAAARAIAFGLVWAGNPDRAAYEAALSASVTHGHPMGVSGAAAMAAAVSLATTGDGQLDAQWLEAIAKVTAEYEQVEIHGATLLSRLQLLPSLVGQPAATVLNLLGTGSLASQAVPAALWCATRPGLEGVFEAVNAGGDTDTIAAMAGACLGARFGASQIPVEFTQVRGLNRAFETAGRLAAMTDASTPQPKVQKSTEPAEAVHVSFLIDRSGSMQHMVGDVIGGYNEFVKEQQAAEGKCTFTSVQFDSTEPFKVNIDAADINEVPELTTNDYEPRGLTPLLDAFGMLIKSVAKREESLEKPEDQILVIFTDGQENASTKWTYEVLFNLVAEKEAEGWTFVFMGANQDSYNVGGQLGIRQENIQNFRGDGRGTRAAMKSFSRGMSEYRSAVPEEKIRRKGDFYDGRKEAEIDHKNR
jgi:ADP-ribosylglycohydrolase